MKGWSVAHKCVIPGLILLLPLVACLSGCSKTGSSLPKPKIAILEDKPLEWAAEMKDGFRFGLVQKGIDVETVSRSAKGDPKTLSAISEEFIKGDYKLIYSLGTQATKEAFHQTKTRPIIFGAVTDPVKAGLFAADLEHPLGNITGTVDLWPYSAQFDLIRAILPKLKKIGIVYNSNESNSQVSVKYIEAECRKRNIRFVEKTATTVPEVQKAVNALLNESIDLLFIPSDNTVQAASGYIIESCQAKNVPVFTGVCEIVEKGALAAVGVNYYELGDANAQQAAEILLNGKKAGEVPVVVEEKGNICVNLKAAKNLGISIPKEILGKASKIYQYQ